LRSPHAHARIVRVDTTTACAVPGVIGIFTGEDIRPIQKPLPAKVAHPDLQEIARLPMALDAVHYVGEPVAIVVATSRYIAEDAADLIEVDYDVLPAVSSVEAAMRPDAPLAHEGARDNIAVHAMQRAGDVDAAFERAPHRLAERFVVVRSGGHS